MVDFVEGLLNSKGKDTIMLILDIFIKLSQFIGLSHPFTTKMVAKMFLNHFFKFHGLPVTLMTKKDMMFTNLF